MDDRGRRRSLETYDLGIGFFAFFAVAFFVVSLFFQLSGRDPIWASLSALFAMAVTGTIVLFRRRYAARSAGSEQP